jgi:hypothetical protein
MSELFMNIEERLQPFPERLSHGAHRYQSVIEAARIAGPFSPNVLNQLLVFSYVFS